MLKIYDFFLVTHSYMTTFAQKYREFLLKISNKIVSLFLFKVTADKKAKQPTKSFKLKLIALTTTRELKISPFMGIDFLI